jgi:hypothetical protein
MSRKMKVGVEIVDDLGEDTGPVDRVDSAETMRAVELDVGEERLDGVLPRGFPHRRITNQFNVSGYEGVST